MNTTRLLLLADFLDTVPDHKFDLSSWRVLGDPDDDFAWYNNGKDYRMSVTADEQLFDHSCGTTGCAVGWACAMPEFQQEGLQWRNMAPTYATVAGVFVNWHAVEQFFDISEAKSIHLFDFDSYTRQDNTPGGVAKRIREVVAVYQSQEIIAS